MIKLFKWGTRPKKTELTQTDRAWLDMAMNTSGVTKALFANRDAFALLAAAVFALQQDALVALEVDLRSFSGITDFPKPEAPAALQRSGEHLQQVMETLHQIDTMNINFLEAGAPSGVSEADYTPDLLVARMRSLAARIWLLSIYARWNDKDHFELAVIDIWMMLKLVSFEEVLEGFEVFTGTFFDNISTSSPNPDNW